MPCRFELDAPYLGHLESSSSTGLAPGTALSLPLWLAEMLALATPAAADEDDAAAAAAARAPLTLSLPPCLAPRVAAALKADARAVALRDHAAHFYAVGVRMLDLFDEPALAALLRRAFVVRAADVALHARRADDAAAGSRDDDFLRGLDEWERLLFRRAHEGVKRAKEWMDGVKRS